MASFQKDWLEGHEHELPQLIVRARKLNKARTTFIDKMIKDNQYFMIKATMVELVSKLSKLPVTSKAWEKNSKDLERLKKAKPLAWMEIQ